MTHETKSLSVLLKASLKFEEVESVIAVCVAIGNFFSNFSPGLFKDWGTRQGPSGNAVCKAFEVLSRDVSMLEKDPGDIPDFTLGLSFDFHEGSDFLEVNIVIIVSVNRVEIFFSLLCY